MTTSRIKPKAALNEPQLTFQEVNQPQNEPERNQKQISSEMSNPIMKLWLEGIV